MDGLRRERKSKCKKKVLIAHCNKSGYGFFMSGAVRIGSSKWTPNIDTVSFKNLDGSIVTIVLNSKDEDVKVNLRIKGKIVQSTIEAHSIATYILDLG